MLAEFTLVAVETMVLGLKTNVIKSDPIKHHVAAISCGIYAGTPIVDLDYLEDSDADVDANFVMSSDMKLIEIQGSAEGSRFTRDEFNTMINLAEIGIKSIMESQKVALKQSA